MRKGYGLQFDMGAVMALATSSPAMADRQREEMMGLLEDRKKAAQKKLAKQCDLTVISTSDSALHAGGLDRFIADSFAGERRYDLLALPRLDLAARGMGLDLLASDAESAIGLHDTEKLLVVGPEQHAGDVHVGIRTHRRLRENGFAASAARWRDADMPSDTCVVTCMDWRLHGAQGLLASELRACGLRLGAFDLMTVPGVSLDLRYHGSRFEFVAAHIRHLHKSGLKRLVLVGHTDFGKYGGSGAFGSALKEAETIGNHLVEASRNFSAAFPDLAIDIALARTGSCDVAGVIPLSHLLN